MGDTRSKLEVKLAGNTEIQIIVVRGGITFDIVYSIIVIISFTTD